MIGVIATLRIKSDKGAEFEAVFAELTSQVRATESGNAWCCQTNAHKSPFRADQSLTIGFQGHCQTKCTDVFLYG